MDTRKITGEYRLARWSEIVHRRTLSGMNVREFCECEGFHENTYYYWQRRLRESACKGQATGALPAPDGWATVVSAKPEVSTALPTEIGKCRVLANRDTDERLLAKVCRVLASL
jgi:putative transposase